MLSSSEQEYSNLDRSKDSSEGSLFSSSSSYDLIDDYYVFNPEIDLEEITKTEGKLYYFISNEIRNKNPLIKEYKFTEDEKKQYCNIDKFMYNEVLYDFKIYTLDIPFIYYKEKTNYTFYLILLEKKDTKKGLIYLQNKETTNPNKSYYDIRCIFNNKCDKQIIIPTELTEKIEEVFEALKILLDNSNKYNDKNKLDLINLIKILINKDDISQFEIKDYELQNAFINIRSKYDISVINFIYKNIINSKENIISFYEKLLKNINIESVSDYFSCNYFGMDESWSSGRVDEAQYCIKLSDKYHDHKYETYVDILHSHPRCDFEKYKKFKKLDIMFTLIYKILTAIKYKGEIYIEDASKYYIDLPSNVKREFTIIDDYDDKLNKIMKEYDETQNIFEDRNEPKKYIAFETHIFSVITKKHTLYNSYGFKPDYINMYNNLNNIIYYYKILHNILTKKINELNSDTNKDNISNIEFELNNIKLPDQIKISIYDMMYIYNLILQLLNIWFQIYYYKYYDEYNKLYQKENKTTNNLNYLIINKDSINFWNHFYNYNITYYFIELFYDYLIIKEKADDISEFNKCYPLFFDYKTMSDKIDLHVSNIPNYTTSFRKGRTDLSKSSRPFNEHTEKEPFNLSNSTSSRKIRPTFTYNTRTMNPLSKSSGQLPQPILLTSNRFSSIIPKLNSSKTFGDESNSSSSSLSSSLSSYSNLSDSSSLESSNSHNLSGGNLNIKYKQFNKKYHL